MKILDKLGGIALALVAIICIGTAGLGAVPIGGGHVLSDALGFILNLPVLIASGIGYLITFGILLGVQFVIAGLIAMFFYESNLRWIAYPLSMTFIPYLYATTASNEHAMLIAVIGYVLSILMMAYHHYNEKRRNAGKKS